MRKLAVVIGLIASAFASSAMAEAAQQFDLICQIDRKISPDGPASPIETRFRIDLVESRYCWKACDRIEPIDDVAPDRITFRRERVDTYRERRSVEESVSRVDGIYRQDIIEIRPVPSFVEGRGVCTVAPFSGFPTTLF